MSASIRDKSSSISILGMGPEGVFSWYGAMQRRSTRTLAADANPLSPGIVISGHQLPPVIVIGAHRWLLTGAGAGPLPTGADAPWAGAEVLEAIIASISAASRGRRAVSNL